MMRTPYGVMLTLMMAVPSLCTQHAAVAEMKEGVAGEPCSDLFAPDHVLATMHRVNDYAKAHPWRETDRNWIRGTWYTGVMEAYHATGDTTYLDQARQWAEKHRWQVGGERSGFNRLFCAMTWVELYLLDPDPKKIAPLVEALASDVPYAPVIGKVWYGHEPHNNDAGHVYADALYGGPALAMLYKATGEQHYLDVLHDAFWRVTDSIYDQDADLYYRDPSYIGKTSPNGGKILWSRGNGWVFGGLPRLLHHLPQDDPYYDRYVALYRRMAKSLAARQGDDGFWRSNLGDPQHYTMPESSGTAFFTAGFAWGVRQGILDKETYLPVVIRGWEALNRAVHPDGTLGWVQPVDAEPRPSHPRSSQEYAVGLFLSAGGQVYRLITEGLISPSTIQAARLRQSDLLPPSALHTRPLRRRDHPLSDQITTFLRQQPPPGFHSTQLGKSDYLDVIAGQVKAMQSYQNAEGRIVDPVSAEEKYYTTPCYAHCVAVLAKAKHPMADELLESGMKALDVSLADMAASKAPGGHGDFFTWPIVFAFELFADTASASRRDAWRAHLGAIDPSSYGAYRKPLDRADHAGFYRTFDSDFANNWNLVNTAGEFSRVQNGFGDPWYVDYCLTMQLHNFTPHGMYNEHGNPLPYDLFARHYLTGMLQRGYRSFVYTTYRDILWRGAWTSLFMQSPFGELPTGYRSSHHIWNEAEQAVIFEVYASAYAHAGRKAEAGAFKRAAHLSLASIKQWIRPDGSGYIVKNRYPIDAQHGYERYSVHACYNMLAMSMLAQAWQFADDEVAERPAPADVGGFAFELPTFHKVFANAGGTYIEYDTNGDQRYNPTGLLRVHLKNGHPQLGPSDGCGSLFSGEGQSIAVGPSWTHADGTRMTLAGFTEQKPMVEILNMAADQVQLRVTYRYENAKSGRHINLTSDNTVAVDSPAPWYSTDSATEAKWLKRTLNGHTIYEAQSLAGANSGCELKTTLTGLHPGQDYVISVVNGLRDHEQWQVLCGLSPRKDDAVLSRGMMDQTATVTRKALYHALVHEGQTQIGTAPANADGTIDVYTFIPSDIAGTTRCWLAGFTCEPVPADDEPVRRVDRTVQVTELFTIQPDGVQVENDIQGIGVSDLQLSFPMLVFDGQDETTVEMGTREVRMSLADKHVTFEVLEPAGASLKRTGQPLKHRNGLVEKVVADIQGHSAVYRIHAE